MRRDKTEEVFKNKLTKLVCPSPSTMDWVVDSIRADQLNKVDNHVEERQALEGKINRLEKMDDTLYDDKLSGEISPEKYQTKHLEITDQITELKAHMTNRSIDSGEAAEEAISIIKLSQKAADIYEDQTEDEKRFILTKLFIKAVVIGDTVSVNYTKFANVIAQNSEEMRSKMNSPQNDNQTFENDQNNRGGNTKIVTEMDFRPLWQGLRDDYRTHCGIISISTEEGNHHV